MPKTFARAPARARRGLACLCLSLALAGTAQAADPARKVTVKLGAADQAIEGRALPAEPRHGVGLLQRLALLIDMIATGRTAAELAAPAAPGEGTADAGGVVEIIPYSGPLAAGTVVINLERYQLFRILGGGFAELYQERSEAAVLTRIGMVRPGEGQF